MSFPWKRGDGHFMLTISVPLILNPIVKELRNDNQLSRTISEFLWLRFGTNDVEAQEAQVNILLKEKLALEQKIKAIEIEAISRRDNQQRVERLEEISGDIDRYRRIRNNVKNNPRGKWQYIKIGGLQKLEIEEARKIIEAYGSEEAFIQEWDSWVSEKESLILEIGQNAARKS